MFPDIVFELASQWNQPLSIGITLPDYGQYLDLYGAEKAGLVNSPPMEPSLYIVLYHNHGARPIFRLSAGKKITELKEAKSVH